MQETLEYDKRKQELYGLFHDVQHLRKSENYLKYLHFLCRFKSYSAFNVFLQKPRTVYFATPSHWRRAFNREIKPEARPLVILRPMEPVMFVYDLEDTIGDDEATLQKIRDTADGKRRPHPHLIDSARLTENLEELRIHVQWLNRDEPMYDPIIRLHKVAYKEGPRFDITINRHENDTLNLVKLIQQLAHILCGHFGSLQDERWPGHHGHTNEAKLFEAESVAYLVCKRMDLEP